MASQLWTSEGEEDSEGSTDGGTLEWIINLWMDIWTSITAEDGMQIIMTNYFEPISMWSILDMIWISLDNFKAKSSSLPIEISVWWWDFAHPLTFTQFKMQSCNPTPISTEESAKWKCSWFSKEFKASNPWMEAWAWVEAWAWAEAWVWVEWECSTTMAGDKCDFAMVLSY